MHCLGWWYIDPGSIASLHKRSIAIQARYLHNEIVGRADWGYKRKLLDTSMYGLKDMLVGGMIEKKWLVCPWVQSHTSGKLITEVSFCCATALKQKKHSRKKNNFT